MWKSLAMLAIGVVVMAGWLSLAPGQNPPAGGSDNQVQPDVTVRGPEMDMPRRVARDFAPWIEAVIQQKPDVSNRLFPLRRAAQETVDSPQALRIFRKFPRLDGIDLTLVGGRGLGEQMGVVLFTIATEEGPVAFKIYHYRYGNNRYVGKVEITDDWAEIERMYVTVDPLQVPVTVPL